MEYSKKWFISQWYQIQQGEPPILRQKLGSLLLYMIKILALFVNSVWAVPAVILMRALRPWMLIRIGTIISTRIGHFVVDAAENKILLIDKPPNSIDLFWLGKKTCNQQWTKMVRREMPVYDWSLWLDIWNKFLPGNSSPHQRPPSYTGHTRDVKGLFQRYDARFAFSEVEEKEAKKWLMARGWQDGEPFVCVLVRDSAYLAKNGLHGDGSDISYKKWSYHDFRDSDIACYVSALEWLADRGVFILRMGKIMEKRMESNHRNIIDYAFCDDKSDLLDMWLFANCTFCITTGTGIDGVCKVYRRPMFYLNCPQLGMLDSSISCFHVPKDLHWAANGKALNLKEILSHNYFSSDEYSEAGLKFRDLSAKEILSYTMEFWQRQKNIWQDKPADLDLQSRFWEIIENWNDYSKFHGWRHPDARVSTIWLQKQSEDFFD